MQINFECSFEFLVFIFERALNIFRMSEFGDFPENFDSAFDQRASEEVKHLDIAIDETIEIKDELKETLEYLKQLSLKYDKLSEKHMLNLSPGISWHGNECLRFNFDSLINEERQQHDLNSPQQHHKALEINDVSSASISVAKSHIINHLNEASLEQNIDDVAADDSMPLNQQPELLENGDYHLDFLHRHSISCRKTSVDSGQIGAEVLTSIDIKAVPPQASTALRSQSKNQ